MNRNIWNSIRMKCYRTKFTVIARSEWFWIFDCFIRIIFCSKNFIHQIIIIHMFDGVAVVVVYLIFHGLTHIRALTFLVGSRNRNTLFGTQFNDKKWAFIFRRLLLSIQSICCCYVKISNRFVENWRSWISFGVFF